MLNKDDEIKLNSTKDLSNIDLGNKYGNVLLVDDAVILVGAGVAIVATPLIVEAYEYTQSPEFKEEVNKKWLEIKETASLGIDYTKFYLIAVKEFLLNNTELTEKDIIIGNNFDKKEQKHIPLDNKIENLSKTPPIEGSQRTSKDSIRSIPLTTEEINRDKGIKLKNQETLTYKVQVKQGDVIDTPETNPDIFRKEKNEGFSGYTNKKDGSWWEKDNLGSNSHGGSVWKRWTNKKNKNKKPKKEDGDRKTIDKKGKVLRD